MRPSRNDASNGRHATQPAHDRVAVPEEEKQGEQHDDEVRRSPPRMFRRQDAGAFGNDAGDARRPCLKMSSRFGMSLPNRCRCSQPHARCARSKPFELPAARSTDPSVCVASWMNATASSTHGTTMISVTAAVLIDAASRAAEAALEAFVLRMEKRRENGRPRQRGSERARTTDREDNRGGGRIRRRAAWCFAHARVDPASATNLTPTLPRFQG